MKKVLVLGSSGMLGHAVVNYLKKYPEEYEVFMVSRASYESSDHRWCRFIDIEHDLEVLKHFHYKNHFNYAINCIGVVKQKIKQLHQETEAIQINSVLPRVLAQFCNDFNIKMIHITSDCVFSGIPKSAVCFNNYTEASPHDALDVYGRSKSLGEPTTVMNIRTSIIGEELLGNYSLLGWFKTMKGKTVQGFSNHYWNGVTTFQLAKCLDQILHHNLWEPKTVHIFGERVTKYDMLMEFNKLYNDNTTTVEKCESSVIVDRTLSSIYTLSDRMGIPYFQQMMKEFKNR